ncbi:hypothetical protein, partial [Klebsiella pneumoniae]|uniref:hypothetical protein n=1 Tax=Klebsiella pneumoniae TaxID=573 RepID=UPI00272F3E70
DAIIKIAPNTHQYQGGGNNQSAFERFSKHRPQPYSGSVNPTVLTEWSEAMEKLLELSKTPPTEKVNVVAYYLKGEA